MIEFVALFFLGAVAFFVVSILVRRRIKKEKELQVALEQFSTAVSTNKAMVIELLNRYAAFFVFITPWCSHIVSYLNTVELDATQYAQLKKMKNQLQIFNAYVVKLSGVTLSKKIKASTRFSKKKTPLLLAKNMEAYANVARILESDELSSLSFTSVYPVYMNFIEHLHEVFLPVLAEEKNKEAIRYFSQAIALRRELETLLDKRSQLKKSVVAYSSQT